MSKRRLRLRGLIGPHLLLELEPTEIAEQRALLERERIRFAMKGLQALGGPSGLRFGPCAIGLSRADGDGGTEAREAGNDKETAQCQQGSREIIASSCRQPRPQIRSPMRILGIDVGRRRIGVAISDATGTLARPLTTIRAADTLERTVELVTELVHRLSLEDEGLAEIVVGLPKHLDGSPSEQTGLVTAFAAALEAAVILPIRLQDERLTSREAESRLAETDRNWRTRKMRLDAAAAAVFLQDHLDQRRDGGSPGEDA